MDASHALTVWKLGRVRVAAPSAVHGTRPHLSTIAFALLGFAVVASAVLLAYWGRGQAIGSDELQYATRLSTQSLGHAMIYPPPDGYLIAAPLLVYRALFETAGLGDYAAHRAVAIALVLTSGILFYALARRRVGDLWALPPTVLLLFFGYGSESVLTAERIPGSMALAAGLGAFLALAQPKRMRDVLAALLLILAVASHPVGIAFAAGAAVLVLCRPPPGRWRSAWIFILPGLIYAGWWLLLRPAARNPTQTQLSEIASFVGQSWTAVTAAISGLAGVLDGAAYHDAFGWLAAALLLALVAAGIAASWRRLRPQFWAAAAALLTLWITTGLTRGDEILMAFRPADLPRYLYPAAPLMLLMLVELAGAVRFTWRAAAAATVVLTLGLVANIQELDHAGDEGRRLADPVRAAYGATELASKTDPPVFHPLGFFYPATDDYLAAVRAFGSMGYSAAELETRPAATRVLADKTLVRAERVRPESAHGNGSIRPPTLTSALQGTVREIGGCLRLRPMRGVNSVTSPPSIPPPPSGRAASGAPALAAVSLPPGGASIVAARPAQVAVRIGRFSDRPSLPLMMPGAGRFTSLAIPKDGVTVPWRLIVYSPELVSVCGLRTSGAG